MENSMIFLISISILLTCGNGSVIELQSSHSNLKPLLTTNMTMRCSLKDSAPSSQVIGKRSVDNLTTGQQLTGRLTDHTNSDSQDQDHSKRSSPVTHTDDNMLYAISMVISRDDVDLARVSEHFPATVAAGLSGFEVSGQLNNGGNTGEMGYLQIQWSHPSLSEAGTYKCEISALNKAGHSVDFSQILEINTGDVTIPDLVSYLQDLTVERENKDKTIAMLAETLSKEKEEFNKTVEALTQELASVKTNTVPTSDFNSLQAELSSLKTNTVPKADFNSLQAELSSLKTNTVPKADFISLETKFNTQKAEISALKTNTVPKADFNALETKFNSLNANFTALKAVARQEPDIFFTVGISAYGQISINAVGPVIYDKIYTNKGSGYDSSTGVFTAPVSGYYRFDVHMLSYYTSNSLLAIKVNGAKTVDLMGYSSSGDQYKSASNSLITHLASGDTVNVASRISHTSSLWTQTRDLPDNTFSGNILSVD